MSTTETKTEQIDFGTIVDGIPGGDEASVITDSKPKPSIFTANVVDMSVFDSSDNKDIDNNDENDNIDKENNEDKDNNEDNNKDTKKKDDNLDDILDLDNNDDKNKKTKEIISSSVVSTFDSLIKDEVLIPFDDDKKLSEYTNEDIKELIKANIENVKSTLSDEIPKEVLASLPDEMKLATQYYMNGGKDYKTLFKILSDVETTTNFDITEDTSQESIVKKYLQATDFGTEEEIDEEITSLKDMDKLEQRAKQFKPKLLKIHEKNAAEILHKAEQDKKKKEEIAKGYMNSVYEALKEGTLGNIKIDRKLQNDLYIGLVQPNYPSLSGRNTNLLGHLLEKYQYTEPNVSLIAEALWLLSDPDTYRKNLISVGKNKATVDTVRKLKTEQQNKNAGSDLDVDGDNSRSNKKVLSRQNNFFKPNL